MPGIYEVNSLPTTAKSLKIEAEEHVIIIKPPIYK